MKKLMFMLLILGSIQGVYAQRTEKSKKFMVDKTLFEELTDVKKKSDKNSHPYQLQFIASLIAQEYARRI